MRRYLVLAVVLFAVACNESPTQSVVGFETAQQAALAKQVDANLLLNWPKDVEFLGTGSGENLGDVPALNFSANQDFTILCRVQLKQFTKQQAQYIISMNYSCSPTLQGLFIQNTGPNAGKACFYVRGANDKAACVWTNIPLQFNRCHHIAAVRSYKEKTIKLYLDGRLCATAPDAIMAGLAKYCNDYIGARNSCPDNSTFCGRIKEVQIYAAALSEKEIHAKINQ